MIRLTTKKMINALLCYWLVLSGLFFLYIFAFSINKGISMQNLISSVPELTVAMLIVCLMLSQAIILFSVSKVSKSKSGILGNFVLVTILQQFSTGNIPGAILAYCLRKSLTPVEEYSTFEERIIFYVAVGCVLLVSLLTIIIVWRMRGV